MELDKRIKKGKRPLTCFDLKEAEQFIGKKGYFAHCIDYYEDLKSTVFGTLSSTEDGDHSSFVCTEETFDNYYYHFFIPEDWVLPEAKSEKTYRPYSLNEFLERFKIGNTVTFRLKKGEHVPEEECRVEYTRLITGYETLPENRDIPGKSSILLGGCPPTSLARLFEFYELQNKYYFPTVWQPFGVIEDE